MGEGAEVEDLEWVPIGLTCIIYPKGVCVLGGVSIDPPVWCEGGCVPPRLACMCRQVCQYGLSCCHVTEPLPLR